MPLFPHLPPWYPNPFWPIPLWLIHGFLAHSHTWEEPEQAKTEIFQLLFRRNTFWWSTLRLCKNFACGWNQKKSWCSQPLWSKFSFKKIKMEYYDILVGHQATLSGAKSKMKTTLNGHNTPLLFFYMKLWTYLRMLGKEWKNFIHRQSH